MSELGLKMIIEASMTHWPNKDLASQLYEENKDKPVKELCENILYAIPANEKLVDIVTETIKDVDDITILRNILQGLNLQYPELLEKISNEPDEAKKLKALIFEITNRCRDDN